MTQSIAGDSSYFLDLYSRYCRNPASVPADWRVYFETLDIDHWKDGKAAPNIDALLDGYRRFGYRQASLDPLSAETKSTPQIELLRRQILDSDEIEISIAGQKQRLSGTAACERLDRLYAGTAAIEASHIVSDEERGWLFETFEQELGREPDEPLLARTLQSVLLAAEFEKFVGTKWPTKKRFGLEGAETATVAMNELLRAAAGAGMRQAVAGGMHRGRLAMLATVFGKPLEVLLSEIKGRDLRTNAPDFTGDVPYHNGLESHVDTEFGPFFIRLLPHPSHLVTVAPVCVGLAWVSQRAFDREGRSGIAAVLPILMHTDAAFSGQGLIWELLQLSALEGFSVGGTIHLVINNRIGFTTTEKEARSSVHPTDVAKAFSIPVLHVNADDPVAVAAVARVAFAWRNHTGRDVIIDLVCYRRNGHNELDEPRFTQPRLYAAIDAKAPVNLQYSQHVRAISRTAHEAAEHRHLEFRDALARAYAAVQTDQDSPDGRTFSAIAPSATPADEGGHHDTGLERERLLELTQQICALPPGFAPDSKVAKFLERRLQSIEVDSGFDMATAEALAWASLLAEGVSIRLSGQDCVRGTFSQRHLAIHDHATGEQVVPLSNVASEDATFHAVNSPLSEYGVLGFEYGTSLSDGRRLTIWEAQFGDFLNGAQVMVDQFITTAEAKWSLHSNLVVALPHGLEGQGPDHSSCRIERLLQSAVHQNVIVAWPSTPANLFHLYRRQGRSGRKPLFLVAPKSLLRNRECASHLEQIVAGTRFEMTLVDGNRNDPNRVILCAGKLFHALRAHIREQRIEDVKLISIEQLYPFPMDEVLAAIGDVAGRKLVWCQEEPRNQGAWPYFSEVMREHAPHLQFSYVGRPSMAASAGGSIDRHDKEQMEILNAAVAE